MLPASEDPHRLGSGLVITPIRYRQFCALISRVWPESSQDPVIPSTPRVLNVDPHHSLSVSTNKASHPYSCRIYVQLSPHYHRLLVIQFPTHPQQCLEGV